MNQQIAILRLRETIRRQHKALSTESTYVYWLGRYIQSVKTLPRHLSSTEKLERFLTELACKYQVSASTQNQALNAIVYFYQEVLDQKIENIDALRAKRPVHIRHAPTPAETQALLKAVEDQLGYPNNLVARLLYGCGLRVSEPLNLRIKDVNFTKSTLCIRGAKGGNDRFVNLPGCLVPELKRQMEYAHSVWRQDVRNDLPVMLPHRLAKKYPSYRFSWLWFWLFPARYACPDPRTGQRVRYRMHEANVQRAVKRACHKLGLRILPHELRHGYATHCLDRGTNPRAIQQAMGHKSLETTMGYLHSESTGVASPLEYLHALMARSRE